jgi:hypothetical protein
MPMGLHLPNTFQDALRNDQPDQIEPNLTKPRAMMSSLHAFTTLCSRAS